MIFQLLYEYDRWANNSVSQAVSTLRVEEFTRDLGGSFHSVRDVLLHMIASKWGWVTYWKEPSPSDAILADIWMQAAILFQSDRFPDIETVGAKWAEVEKEQSQFVDTVTGESLKRMLPLGTRLVSLAHLMQHVAIHSTYHRGQVALMMRLLHAEPVATDFHVFLVDGRREAATAG